MTSISLLNFKHWIKFMLMISNNNCSISDIYQNNIFKSALVRRIIYFSILFSFKKLEKNLFPDFMLYCKQSRYSDCSIFQHFALPLPHIPLSHHNNEHPHIVVTTAVATTLYCHTARHKMKWMKKKGKDNRYERKSI